MQFRKIRSTIFASSVLVVVTAVVGSGIGFLKFYDQLTRQSARDTSIQLTELISKNLDSTLSSIQSYVSVYAQNIMKAAQDRTPASILTEHMLVQQLIYSNNNIDRVLALSADGSEYLFDRLLGPNPTGSTDELLTFVQNNKQRIQTWWGSPYWFTIPSDNRYVYLTIATFRYAIPEYSGIVAVGVPISYFESQYAQYPAIAGGAFFVFNRTDEAIYGENSRLHQLAERAARRLNADEPSPGLQTFDFGDAIATAARPSGQLVTFVTVIPKADLFRKVGLIRRTLLATGAVSAIIAFLLAWGLSISIARDLHTLALGARRTAEGDLDHRLVMNRRDEIRDLAESFNAMIARLGTTIEQLSDEKARYKEVEFRAVDAEYRALQASVDPHFLNNVLESINSIAKLHRQEEIARIVASLSYLLRRSLADNRRFVTLRQEIEYVRSYLELQTTVTGQCIATHFEIASDTLDFPVPKLLLQPLVENAVKHGLAGRAQDGVISIVTFKDEKLHIIVSDNGQRTNLRGERRPVGPAAVKDNGRSSPQGFGIVSVQRRISLLYGEEGSFDFSSANRHGTRIEIVLPPSGHGSEARK